MLRRHLHWSVPAVALCVVALLLLYPTQNVSARPDHDPHYRPVVFPGNVGLQVNLQRGTGQAPNTGNATPVYLAAQLVRSIRLQPPFENAPLAIAPLSGPPLTAPTLSQGFSQSCSLTLSDTMLECILTPNPGPNWAVGGPVIARVRLTSTDGYVGAALVNFPIN